MKIIYLTDIHGSYERINTLLHETVADIYIISGDLIDIAFYSMESAINFHELQTFFHGLRRKMKKEDVVLENFVEDLLILGDIPEENFDSLMKDNKDELADMPGDLQIKCRKYIQYTIRARRVMQQKYKVLENIFSTKQSSRIFCIPGNYDMNLKYTSLNERDLHLQWHQIEQFRIAGYGGADIWTAGVPERYVVKYQAGIGINDRKNEMYTFFKAVKPDIIVTHQPAHGIHDRISFIGPSGSPALRTFCDNNPVILCLTGHIHTDWGFKEIEDTIYLNPSNFGKVTTITGDVSEGGFFFQIELDKSHVKRVEFKKLVEDRVHVLSEYLMKKGVWKQKILDQDRYNALKTRVNYDSEFKKYTHIPGITLYNEIKQFYRMYQTRDAEEKVDKMEEVLRSAEAELEEVAVDIVGSVNFGLSQPSSDIDIVLYMRCEPSCEVMYEECSDFIKARAVIEKYIGNEFNFDIIDCINLNTVENSIKEKNYECEVTQRFVVYRAICRPINYRVIAYLEDMLNEDIEYRKELEGSIRAYFNIFVTTSRHVRSMEKYESRLKSIGIKLPEAIRKKVQEYLEGEQDDNT